jgi:hypothetical protein
MLSPEARQRCTRTWASAWSEGGLLPDRTLRTAVLGSLARRGACATLMLLAASGSGCRERSSSKPKPPATSLRSPAPSAAASAQLPDPCASTRLCLLFGRCTHRPVNANDGNYQWIPVAGSLPAAGAVRYSCVASEDADCERSSVACAQHGECAARGGVCVAADNAHCAASRRCESSDLCFAIDGWCQRGQKSFCFQSAACRERGLCSEPTLSLARIEDIFFASRESLISDAHLGSEDMWAPPKPLFEPASFVVANQTTSVRGCVAERSQDCRASAGCREHGRCVARDGECAQARTNTLPQ